MISFAVTDSWQNNMEMQAFASREEADEVCASLNAAHLMAHGVRVYSTFGSGQPPRFWVEEVEDLPPTANGDRT